MLRTLVAELCDQVEIILSEKHCSHDQIRTNGNPPLVQWFSIFLLERNSKDIFQWLEDTLCTHILYVQGNYNVMSVIVKPRRQEPIFLKSRLTRFLQKCHLL